MDTAVIIVAAGRGSRVKARADAIPKQYRSLGGMPVIAHSLAVFDRNRAIDAILPVVHDDDMELFQSACRSFPEKILPAVHGGDTRQQSVLAGLSALSASPPRHVLIHDAARPFLKPRVVDRVLDALHGSAGAIPALPVSDTLKRSEDGMVSGTVDRSGLWAAQTPQGFHFDAIFAAHRAARSEGKDDFTDDASIAEWHGVKVALIEGDAENVKLTKAEDFLIAERRIATGETRTGQGYDVHAFTDGDHVMLCGVRIPHGHALAGHSDADVALHAITDALLGAIGEGDIGTRFPPSDPQWRGAASEVFLKDAARRIAARGGTIVNIDVTLICEAPKIAPHANAMREAVAATLGIETGRIAVKATTTEGLGFTGRGEGIAATAIASVRLP